MTKLIQTGYIITVSPDASKIKIAAGVYDCKKTYFEDKLTELGEKRVNNKVVYYGICNGLDYRLLTRKIAQRQILFYYIGDMKITKSSEKCARRIILKSSGTGIIRKIGRA